MTRTLRVLPPQITAPTLNLWTDGSLKDKSMGAGAIITYPTTTSTEETIITTESTRLTDAPGQESSTRPELFAIYRGLRQINPASILSIFTDSMSAIRAIKMIQHPLHSIREKLKTPNYAIVEAIIAELNRFTTRPSFTWVRGHNGSKFNEAADEAAKQGRKQSHAQDINTSRLPIHLQERSYLYHNGVKLEV